MSRGSRRKRNKTNFLKREESAERQKQPTSIEGQKQSWAAFQKETPPKTDDRTQIECETSQPVGNFPITQIVKNGSASNIAIAIFTGALTVLSAIQVWTFLKSESAAIDIEGLGFANDGPIADQRVELLLDVKNSGSLTAEIVNFSINLTLSDLPVKPEYITEPGGAYGFIPAGGFRRTTNSPKHGPGYLALSQKNIDELNHGTRKMHVFGFVSYKDQLWRLTGTRSIGYCFEYIPNSAGTGRRFQSCLNHSYIYNH